MNGMYDPQKAAHPEKISLRQSVGQVDNGGVIIKGASSGSIGFLNPTPESLTAELKNKAAAEGDTIEIRTRKFFETVNPSEQK